MSTENPQGADTATDKKAGGARGKPAARAGKSPRRRAREFALQGLYQWRVGGADAAAIEAHVHNGEGFDKADGDFYRALLRGVLARHEALQADIAPFLDRPFAELSPIESCVLLAAAFELGNYRETPYRVIINESIELAKAFGGADGHKFVNGVLDKLAAQLRPEEVAARRAGR